MRKILLTCFTIAGLMIMQSMVAQQTTVTGIVTDAKKNEALPGVNVVVKNTRNGTMTDAKGSYSIKVTPGQVLVFSSIGFTPQEISVTNQTNIDVRLLEVTQALDEVVVVGYGTQRKANLTGAVSTVNTKILDARPIPDVGRGLQGSTAGLTVIIPSGEVGSDPILKIRGQLGSLQGGSSPLILVDNVEIPSIQLLNPNDIESISVLKDASSSSIYGSKGAFGVILITTKKGAKTESVNVDYTSNFSYQNISKKMDMATIHGMEYTKLAMERVGSTVAGAFWYVTSEGYDKALLWQQNYANKVKPNDPMLYGRDWYVDINNRKIGLRMYDPYDYMVKEWAPTQSHNLSISGKSGKTDYNVGLGYLNQSGIIKPAKADDFKRYNGSIHLGTDINKYVRLTGSALFSKRDKRYGYATSSTTADPWLYMYRWASTYPMTTEDGDPIRNPASEIAAANTAIQETNYTSLTGGLEVTPMRDWKIVLDYTFADQEYWTKRPGTRFTMRDSWSNAVAKVDAAGNRIYMNDAGQVVSSTDAGAMPAWMLNMWTYTAVGSTPDHVYRYSKNDRWSTLNLKTTYDLNMSDFGKLNFMLGMNKVSWKNAYNWSNTTQLVDYSNPQFDLAYGTQTDSGGEYWESQLGFFGRVNYNFKEKYLLEGNLRYDGTSKFPTDLQWRFFPSFSAGWRVNEESWMEWSKPVLSALKLRGSWGIVGDQTVSNSLYVPTMTGSQNSWIISGGKLYQFGTPAAVSATVTWQDVISLNYGFDARFFKSQLGLSLDLFQRDTKNMIVPQEGIPGTFGTSAPQSNTGSLRTKGYEIQLDYNHQFRNGFGINLTASLSNAITTITKYGSTKSIDSWYVGKTYGEIWGYTTDRLFQNADFALDVNGKPVKVTVPNEAGTGTYTIYQLADAKTAIQGRLQSGNFYFGPGDVKFKDLNGDGYINPGNRLITDANGKPDYGDLSVIGNSTPRYLYSFRTDLFYKGVDLSVFIQGVGKREVWGDGFLAIPGYNTSDGAIPEAFANNFWRADRTDAFYPNPYNQAGSNNAYNYQIQSRYLLNMAYLRIKTLSLGYTIPARFTEKVHIAKLRVYGALENFFTFDHLGTLPIDPEEIEGYSMWNTSGYNLSRSGVGVPTYKSASFGIQVSF